MLVNKYLNQLAEENKSEHTIRAYQKALELFVEYFVIETAEDFASITKEQVVAFRGSIAGKPATINSRMRSIKAFYSWLVNFGYASENPFIGVKEVKVEKKVPLILTDEEVLAMLNACGSLQERLMLSVMFTTGMRVEEVSNAKIEDVQQGRILIHGKGNKERTVALQDWVIELLNRHLETLSKEEEYLFPSQRGGGHVSTTALYYRIKRIAQDANIDPKRATKVTPHTTRRVFATKLLNSGTDITVVSHLMGHADIQTTMIYAQVLDGAKDKALHNTFGGFENGE